MRANCAACGSDRKRIDDWVLDFKVPDGWPQPKSNTVCLCTECGLIYYDNDMTAEGYDEYYRNYYAAPADVAGRDDPRSWSHVRVATKYRHITRQHFAARGVQAECVKLNGAVELAPSLGLCRRIVELVSSGATLKANGLVEVHIADITSRFIVNRAALKTRHAEVAPWIERIGEVARAA